MTKEELNLIPFYMKSHLAMEHEHCSTYFTDDERIGFCDHVPKHSGKEYRHWMLDGKVYRTEKKFLEALKDFKL